MVILGAQKTPSSLRSLSETIIVNVTCHTLSLTEETLRPHEITVHEEKRERERERERGRMIREDEIGWW